MSNPIPTIALSIGCDKNLNRQLCRHLGFSEFQVTAVDHLRSFDSRFESTKLEFIALHRESLAQSGSETADQLQRLAACTPMLVIVGDDFAETMPASSRTNRGHEDVKRTNRSDRAAEVAPMIEHASCNVLQRINLLINEIKVATRGDENVGRNIQRIESANQTLRNHIQNLRGVSEPIELNLENRRIDQLLKSTWAERKKNGVEFNLKCEDAFSLDTVRMKSVARAIFSYLNSAVDRDSTIHVYDETVTIVGEPFLRINFATDSSPAQSNPQIEMAMFKRIVELHGGFMDFDIATSEKTVCTLCLPTPIKTFTGQE